MRLLFPLSAFLVGDISRGFHNHVLSVVLCQLGFSYFTFSAFFLQLRAQLQLSMSFCVPHLGGTRDMLVPSLLPHKVSMRV